MRRKGPIMAHRCRVRMCPLRRQVGVQRTRSNDAPTARVDPEQPSAPAWPEHDFDDGEHDRNLDRPPKTGAQDRLASARLSWQALRIASVAGASLSGGAKGFRRARLPPKIAG